MSFYEEEQEYKEMGLDTIDYEDIEEEELTKKPKGQTTYNIKHEPKDLYSNADYTSTGEPINFDKEEPSK